MNVLLFAAPGQLAGRALLLHDPGQEENNTKQPKRNPVTWGANKVLKRQRH